MKVTLNNINQSFSKVKENESWNNEVTRELKMHKIHAYPAKFPSFLISKSLDYAKSKGINIKSIGDIFCGCGTTALEAKRNGIQFWGCDINPVATLIAKVKRGNYLDDDLSANFQLITKSYHDSDLEVPFELLSHERLNYWFHYEQIKDLNKLLSSIKKMTQPGELQDFFLVAFSNILKRSSKWLTKSIKPQLDPIKPIYTVIDSFSNQFKLMLNAVKQVNLEIKMDPEFEILHENFLNVNSENSLVDMLITSPPYVTSYEYADLHQLSTMWLGYANDYRELRNGTIGSLYNHTWNIEEIKDLDPMVLEIYHGLKKVKKNPKSVIKYFVDIKETVNKSYALVNKGGLAIFVIGNTTYQNVYVDNAKYITKCMLKEGFQEVEVFTRKITGKILSPYRDAAGKFSNNKNDRKVYNYEYVVIGKKI